MLTLSIKCLKELNDRTPKWYLQRTRELLFAENPYTGCRSVSRKHHTSSYLKFISYLNQLLIQYISHNLTKHQSLIYKVVFQGPNGRASFPEPSWEQYFETITADFLSHSSLALRPCGEMLPSIAMSPSQVLKGQLFEVTRERRMGVKGLSDTEQ